MSFLTLDRKMHHQSSVRRWHPRVILARSRAADSIPPQSFAVVPPHQERRWRHYALTMRDFSYGIINVNGYDRRVHAISAELHLVFMPFATLQPRSSFVLRRGTRAVISAAFVLAAPAATPRRAAAE